MFVRELTEALERRNESLINVGMAYVDVADDASEITINNTPYLLDEKAERALAKYLHIPYKYLADCDPTFKATTLRYWRDVYAEADTIFELVEGGIVSVHSAENLSIPIREIGRVVSRVFDPSDEVTYYVDDTRLHLDVITSRHQIEVPNADGMPNRPEVGDITKGGVRFLAYPHQNKPPAVLDYLERLVCTNGMTRTEKSGLIAIKGLTIDEIIEEMEIAAHTVLAGLDEKLDKYAATAKMVTPGTPLAFAYQLGRELGFPAPVMHKVVALVNQLPPNATVYDVNQAFTYVANYDLPYGTRMKLQGLGGELAFNAEQVCARCDTCEQLLT